MKTPRQVLIERHQAAEPKLNAIREKVLADLEETTRTDSPVRSRVSGMDRWPGLPRFCCREFLFSLRWHLATLGAAWLLVVLLNIDHCPVPGTTFARQDAPSPRQFLMVFQENRRQLRELLESPAAETTPPPRRSELQSIRRMDLILAA